MAGLKELKKRLESVGSTALLTSAMKMVSASKLRKVQAKLAVSHTYVGAISDIYTIISSKFKNSDVTNLFINGRETTKKMLVVVITSNKGLCGSFNLNICKFVEAKLKEEFGHLLEKDAIELLCLGNKGIEYFTARNYKLSNIANDMNLNIENCDFNQITCLGTKLTYAFYNSIYDEIAVVYYRSINAMNMDIKFNLLLPIEGIKDDIALVKPSIESVNFAENIIFPQNQKAIFAEILPMFIAAHLNHMLLDSATAENGARMIAMTKASDNATALTKSLKLSYNKMRQANITNELLEIISGANALNK